MIEDVPGHPNIWSDGSREPIPHLDVEVAGAEVLLKLQTTSAITMNGDMRKIRWAI